MGVNKAANGKIDRIAMTNYLLNELGKDKEVWEGALNTAVDKCFQIADMKAREWQEVFALPPGFDGDKVCHPISGEVLGCIINEIFLECPDNIYKKCKYTTCQFPSSSNSTEM